MTNIRLFPIRHQGLTWTAIGLCAAVVLLLGFVTTPEAAGPTAGEQSISASQEDRALFASYTAWLAAAHGQASAGADGGELSSQF